MRRTLALVSALALATTMLPAAVLAAPQREAVIVVFVDDVGNAGALTRELARQHGFNPTHVYEHALNGFAATMPAAAVDALRNNKNVARVEPDGMAHPTESPQPAATWGLDRIDQRTLPLSTTYRYAATGTGVTAYIIDSGILSSHTEFGGRATLGRDFVGTNGGEDCNGHGTHVAGTIGGTTYGVAKNVSLVSVRVFDCTGGASWSTVIAAVDWVTADADLNNDGTADKPAVVNMSLSGGANSSIDQAVRNSIASGVSYAIAAGNSGANACNYSPARVGEAMTIGATDKTDTKPSWSNYGNCVDWFAPGVSITSATYTGTSDTKSMSGTSMAAPHTAGVAALYLEDAPAADPLTVRTALYSATTTGVVTSSSTANNHLLYNLYPEDAPPSVAITAPADASVVAGENVTITATATDDVGVSQVEFFAGERSIALDLNGADGWSAVWNLVDVADGPVTLTATATDTAGNTASDSIAVTVDNINEAPAAGFTYRCAGLTCDFDGSRSTDDRGIASYAWDFGEGATASGAAAQRPFASAGTYSVTLTVTDTNGLTDTNTQLVTVSDAPATMYVADLVGRSNNAGSKWTATVTIVVVDSAGRAVPDATVAGDWSRGSSDATSCTTDAAGQCEVTSGSIAKRQGTVTFTVTAATHATWTYDPTLNVESSITVAKP